MKDKDERKGVGLVEGSLGEMTITDVKSDDIDEIVAMIQAVFDRFIAPGFEKAGAIHFKQFIRSTDIKERLARGSLMLIARYERHLAGMIEIKEGGHIALLFTAERFQRQGIAKTLLMAALERCREEQMVYGKITVNAAPTAVTIYEKMGFVCTSLPQEKYGVRYVPMEKNL